MAPNSTQQVTVGVLSYHNSKETKAILNAVEALGHDPVWIRQSNTHATTSAQGVTVEPEVDVLANRLLLTKSATPHLDLQFAALYEHEVPVLNPAAATAQAIDKYRTSALLAEAGVPIPDAFLAKSLRAQTDWDDNIQQPAVHKPAVGTNGADMEVVENGDTPSTDLGGRQAFLQEYVDTGDGRATDIRVYVVDGDIVGAMRRTAPVGEWRANVALGADVEDVTHSLDDEARRVALDAVDVLGLDYAGVDLIDDCGRWCVLEVNATAGFKGLFDATGTSAAPHIARAAIERASGTVRNSEIDRIAASLDDSVPDCKPPLAPDRDDETTLGYTNEVAVSGSDGAATVVAKADTGAKRTSIDASLAGDVGLGPICGTTTVRTGAANSSETRPLVTADLKVGPAWESVTASVADRSGMRFPMILGRDVLEAYTLDISQRADEE
jgi:RimK family alpha-L-glutamate ligase